MEQSKGLVRKLLFPPRCALCNGFLKGEELDLCAECQNKAEEYPYGHDNPGPKGKISLHFLDSFTAVWYYDGDVRKSIHRFKFSRAIHLAPKYGRCLSKKLKEIGPGEVDILTWVPVSWQRRFLRGYDQCELLAASVGANTGIQVQAVLKKVRHTRRQSSIVSPAKRIANAMGAYRLAAGIDIRGKVILLLDDVHTTGATMDECARVLLAAGAKEVHGAAIAAVRNRK